MIIDRRKLITRMALSTLAAPAIVRYASLMPIKRIPVVAHEYFIPANFKIMDFEIASPSIYTDVEREKFGDWSNTGKAIAKSIDYCISEAVYRAKIRDLLKSIWCTCR